MKKIKKDTYLKVLRIFVWIFIIFIFYRGILFVIRGDRSIQIRNTLLTDMHDYKNEINNKNDVETFTALFVREYMTFDGDIDEYIKKMNKYVNFEIENNFKFKKSKVNFVNVVDSEKVKENIFNIDCLVNFEYIEDEEGTVVGQSEFVLRVPVYTSGTSFVINDYPFAVARSGKADIEKEDLLGELVGDKEKEDIYKTINSFLSAYMEGNTVDMEYFMINKDNFKTGLSGSFKLKAVDESKFTATKDGDFYYVDCTYECEPFLTQHVQFKLVVKDEKYLIDEFDSVIKGE